MAARWVDSSQPSKRGKRDAQERIVSCSPESGLDHRKLGQRQWWRLALEQEGGEDGDAVGTASGQEPSEELWHLRQCPDWQEVLAGRDMEIQRHEPTRRRKDAAAERQ